MERRQRRRRGLSSAGKIGKFSLENSIRTQPTRALYQSYDPFLDRKVAIKIIQLSDPAGDEDETANEAFFAEAQVIGRLQHQNIVSVYDAGVGDYEGYIVMEFIHGESLLQLLKTKNTLSLDEALKVIAQVCHALHYSHTQKIIHRDIKPSNIMVSPDGHVKVVDFGISIISSKQEDAPGLMGTPSYIAPELVHGATPNELSDLYSVAVVLYEMILGKLPFSGDDAHGVLYKVVNNEPEALNEIMQEPVRALLAKALSKEPVERFNSASEFEDEVHKLREQLNANTNLYQDLDTSQLKQMEIFQGCHVDVLHELAACIDFLTVDLGELIIGKNLGSQFDDYLCLIQGRALLVAGERHIIVGDGQWLVRNMLLKSVGEFSCKALAQSQMLRVSKSKLLEQSDASRAYFYQFMMDRCFLQSS